MHQHGNHKVNETKMRSAFKTVTGRLMEITIGTLVFGTILTFLGFHAPYEIGFLLNVTEESLCTTITYITERMWNKISWGRIVIDIDIIEWWGELKDIEGY